MTNKYKTVILNLFLIISYSLIFIIIYGYYNFDIHYTDWLMLPHEHADYGDISINYLNFLAFLNDETNIPYVRVNAYPFSLNMLSIDYAPVVMLFVKIYYKYILNIKYIVNIQYVWLYGLACFILQGVLSFKIIKKSADTPDLNALLCSIFFVTAPPLIYRFPFNFTLASHFLILASFIPFVFNISNKKLIILYFLLGFISCGIASTFIPIVIINIIAYSIFSAITNKNIKFNLFYILSFIFGALSAFGLYGGFTDNIVPYGVGYRYFSANLNTFINPVNVFSLFKSDLFPFLNGLKLYVYDQQEGFAYLGGGIIILCCFSFLWLIKKYKLSDIIQYAGKYRLELLIFIFVFLITLFGAVSLNITFSNRLLLSVKAPVIIEKALSIFRASGRFIWVDFYLIYSAVFLFILKNFSAKKAGIIIFCALVLQIYDLKSAFVFLHNEYRQKKTYENPLFNNRDWILLSKNKSNLITSKIENTKYIERYFYNISKTKFIPVMPDVYQKEAQKRYLEEIKGQTVFNDFYYWAIYNRYKINSLIRSRQPYNNIDFLEHIYKNPQNNDLYLFAGYETDMIKYNTNLRQCYNIMEEYIICTKNFIKSDLEKTNLNFE